MIVADALNHRRGGQGEGLVAKLGDNQIQRVAVVELRKRAQGGELGALAVAGDKPAKLSRSGSGALRSDWASSSA
jgi:hypothetical protein